MGRFGKRSAAAAQLTPAAKAATKRQLWAAFQTAEGEAPPAQQAATPPQPSAAADDVDTLVEEILGDDAVVGPAGTSGGSSGSAFESPAGVLQAPQT